MPDETAEIVRSVGFELVSRLAPEELPLYPSLVSQFQGAKRGGRRGKAGSRGGVRIPGSPAGRAPPWDLVL